jgi:hypothetical protein
VLSMISEGMEIHVVFTWVAMITPRISLLHSFSCFNLSTVVRVLRERSLHLCESFSKFRWAFTRFPTYPLFSIVIPVCSSRAPIDMILGSEYAFLAFIPKISPNAANFSMEPIIFTLLTWLSE